MSKSKNTQVLTIENPTRREGEVEKIVLTETTYTEEELRRFVKREQEKQYKRYLIRSTTFLIVTTILFVRWRAFIA